MDSDVESDIAAGLIKLNPGSFDHVQKWKTMISSRRSEAIQTLVEEGVIVESWFELEIEGQPHLLWYMRKNPDATFHEVFNQSTHEIDQFHRENHGADLRSTLSGNTAPGS